PDRVLEGRLQTAARAGGVADRVVVTGDLDGAIGDAVLVVILEVDEPSMVLGDCLAAGVATVMPDAPATREVTGGVVRVSPDQSMVDAVSTLLADEALRHQLGRAGRDYAASHGFDRVATHLLAPVWADAGAMASRTAGS
ncbi:MAG: hypothetical protein ACRDZY_17745, partial [Acidimicrobiales bacterium]